MVCCLVAASSVAQPAFENRFAQPLGEVLRQTGERFGVRIVCKRFDPDTVRVAYAAFRVRPYSLPETLDGLLHPLGLVWNGTEKITVQPYEYYRRTPADGERLLAWLSAQYAGREAWERRRERLLEGVRDALNLAPFLRGLAADPDVLLGPEIGHDGYTTQNYALETLPGLYVCGTVYAPAVPPLPERRMIFRGRGTHGPVRRPLIVSPAGHWPGGRYRADQQLRMATFARMGAVAVDMDIFGWGESERQVGREAHTAPYSMQVQALWSKAVTDWIAASRRDVDTARMAATGGSGGATHALLLAVTDGRFAALAPVVHLVSHFDGGCPCESGRPVTLAAGGSCMPEILAAAMAPRPVLAVSDGGDWTASWPALEYPFLRRIWDFYDAGAQVRNVHLPGERHDYGANKRRAVYAFFAETLGLDVSQADESRVEVLPEAALCAFPGELPPTALWSRAQLERIIEKLK
ncbi:hypothetical protein [Alistipes sp.]|uniref:alpha/beta hydrolase family protein n=1 Tax=unclassified Alistipes TaxID=2608932 RepID=UPI00307E3153